MRALLASRARWSWLGRVPFALTANWQERLREQVAAGQVPDTLLLCEHDPVITLGRSARAHNVLATPETLAAQGVALQSASRGGDVTYHGPGQLVGYPVFRLRRGVVAHVTWMANAVIKVLAAYGVTATFRRDQPGVWVGAAKVCAFGVHVRRQVAIHGFALNVAPNMAHFDFIVPCGLKGQPVTSMQRLLGGNVRVESVVPALVRALATEADMQLFEDTTLASIATAGANALH